MESQQIKREVKTFTKYIILGTTKHVHTKINSIEDPLDRKNCDTL